VSALRVRPVTARRFDEAHAGSPSGENAADLIGGVSLDDKSDVLASVLLDVTQKEAVSNSVEAADSVLAACGAWSGAWQAGAARGLRGAQVADVPSMLVETAFISNAADERKLRDAAYQQRVAEAIHAGVRNFFLR